MGELAIVTRSPRMISDGLCVSQDAYIVIDGKVPQSIAQQVAKLAAQGLIRVETARLKLRAKNGGRV